MDRSRKRKTPEASVRKSDRWKDGEQDAEIETGEETDLRYPEVPDH